MARKQDRNDAAYRETQRIEPINNIQPVYQDSTVKAKKAKHPKQENHVAMRENKQEHQHTFKHAHENRKSLPRGTID